MAKRFTDNEKWDDPFFFNLPNKFKLLWLFLLDKCDHAGIYKVNLSMAEFCIKEKFNENEILEIFGERIMVLTPEKWFIPKFIYFQYGELTEESRVHNSILKQLLKESIPMGCLKGVGKFPQGVNTLIDTPKDKDKDKDKDKEKGGMGGNRPASASEARPYFQELGFPLEADKFFDYFSANGWKIGGKTPMKDWQAAARTWTRRLEKPETKKSELL